MVCGVGGFVCGGLILIPVPEIPNVGLSSEMIHIFGIGPLCVDALLDGTMFAQFIVSGAPLFSACVEIGALLVGRITGGGGALSR
jgi:hypothetical protein